MFKLSVFFSIGSAFHIRIKKALSHKVIGTFTYIFFTFYDENFNQPNIRKYKLKFPWTGSWFIENSVLPYSWESLSILPFLSLLPNQQQAQASALTQEKRVSSFKNAVNPFFRASDSNWTLLSLRLRPQDLSLSSDLKLLPILDGFLEFFPLFSSPLPHLIFPFLLPSYEN